MYHHRDPDTGYYDPDEYAEAAHEAAMEAEYRAEIDASHGCEFDNPKPMAAASAFYRDLAADLLKEIA